MKLAQLMTWICNSNAQLPNLEALSWPQGYDYYQTYALNGITDTGSMNALTTLLLCSVNFMVYSSESSDPNLNLSGIHFIHLLQNTDF